jgi:hypothetical protein
MKKVKQDLRALNRDLKSLVRKTETLMKAVDRLEKSQAVKAKKVKKATPNPKTTNKIAGKASPKPRATRKAVVKKAPANRKRLTATDKVINIIKKTKKGVSTKALAKKTGFDAQKIANIVFRATKTGKIKSKDRGTYIGA